MNHIQTQLLSEWARLRRFLSRASETKLLFWILDMSDSCYSCPSFCDKVIPFSKIILFHAVSVSLSVCCFSCHGFVQRHGTAILKPISSDGENCCLLTAVWMEHSPSSPPYNHSQFNKENTFCPSVSLSRCLCGWV